MFGPVGADGYYKPLYDKLTGAIDPDVARYWRDHYDHCFTGDTEHSNTVGSRTVHQRYMPAMAQWMIKTAPPGADTTSWIY